jgi:hypothetical protein
MQGNKVMKGASLEFADFPAADFPPLPDGFVDTSWHNNVCPSMTNAALGLEIFCDYTDTSKREAPGGKRFSVIHESDVGRSLLDTDDWNEVLVLIATRRGPYRLGGIGTYGTRCIVKQTTAAVPEVICTVDLASAGYPGRTIEQRRALRDEKATLIVDALNAYRVKHD